jgi:uncharacterized protein YneF (UPF0154 family)
MKWNKIIGVGLIILGGLFLYFYISSFGQPVLTNSPPLIEQIIVVVTKNITVG